MTSPGKMKVCFALFILCTVLSASTVWAHSGHKHDDLPISLPDVTAKVNGAEIRKEVILRELKKTVANYKKKGMTLSADELKTAAKMAIQDEISRSLLVQKGGELGLGVSDAALEDKIAEVKGRFKSEAVFLHKLSDQGMTLDQYRDELRTDLLMDALIKKEIEPGVEIDPKEMKAYYEDNLSKYQSEEKVRASVILIKIRPNSGSEGEREAIRKIESILEQVKIGTDFGGLARKFSQDSLAEKDGDLGFFARGHMLPAFSEQAFSLKVGEVSDPFKTAHGIHLLKVTDRTPGGTRSYEDVRDSIRETLVKKRLGQATQDYVKALKDKADIKTYF